MGADLLILEGGELGKPPGKDQEHADADEQEALNSSEAEALEVDQTHVQTALRDSEAHAIEQDQRDVTGRRMRHWSAPSFVYDVLQARYTKLGEPVAHSPPFERGLFSMGQPRALHSSINLRSIAPPLPWWHACDFG